MELVFWEYPSDAQQGADFIALLAAIRIHLPEDQFFVTAALPAGTSVLQYINIAQAAVYLDFINLMTYDFCGTWDSRSGHHARLYSLNTDEVSCSSGVSYVMASGCPAKKILLGIPVYGRSFMGVSGPGHRHKGGGGQDGTFEYRELPRRHAKESVDRRIGAASCVGGDGGFVSYDNPETVKMKAAFCKQKGLGVSFFFSLSCSLSLSMFLLLSFSLGFPRSVLRFLLMLFSVVDAMSAIEGRRLTNTGTSRDCFTGPDRLTPRKRVEVSLLPVSKHCTAHDHDAGMTGGRRWGNTLPEDTAIPAITSRRLRTALPRSTAKGAQDYLVQRAGPL